MSDDSEQRPGFEICTGDPCIASTSPSDDGSDGNFYCINGGTAGGLPGSCTCTSCNTGFKGPSCATPSRVTLSGSYQGSCYISEDGNCFGTGSADGTYNSDERCTFTFSDAADFAVGRFYTESGYDKLTVGGVEYDGTSGPIDGSVTAGQEIT